MIEIKQPTLGVIPRDDIPLRAFKDALNFRFRQGKMSKFEGWQRVTIRERVLVHWDCGNWDTGNWDTITVFDNFYFDQPCAIFV